MSTRIYILLALTLLLLGNQASAMVEDEFSPPVAEFAEENEAPPIALPRQKPVKMASKPMVIQPRYANPPKVGKKYTKKSTAQNGKAADLKTRQSLAFKKLNGPKKATR